MRKLFIVFVLLAIGLCSSIALSFNANASTPNVTAQFKSMSHDASDVASLIDFSNYCDSITENWEGHGESYWNYSEKDVYSLLEWHFVNAGLFNQPNDHIHGELGCRFGKNPNSSIETTFPLDYVNGLSFYAATYGDTEPDATIQILGRDLGPHWNEEAEWELIDEITLTHELEKYSYECDYLHGEFKFQQVSGSRLNIDDITIYYLNGDAPCTPAPKINVDYTVGSCIITAEGEGNVYLLIDGEEVETPYYIDRMNDDYFYEVYVEAFAKAPGKLESGMIYRNVLIPPVESILPNIENLYLVGEVNGQVLRADNGVQMETNDGVTFTAKVNFFGMGDNGEEDIFAITTKLADDADDWESIAPYLIGSYWGGDPEWVGNWGEYPYYDEDYSEHLVMYSALKMGYGRFYANPGTMKITVNTVAGLLFAEYVTDELEFTDPPVINREITDDSVIISAEGKGEVHLFIDEQEVDNPTSLPRLAEGYDIHVRASAQEPNKTVGWAEEWYYIYAATTPQPEIDFSLTYDAATITATGVEGAEVHLYVNGEEVDNPITLPRYDYEEYTVRVYATAQLPNRAISYSSTMNYVIPVKELNPDDLIETSDWNILVEFYNQYANTKLNWDMSAPENASRFDELSIINGRIIEMHLSKKEIQGQFPTMLLGLEQLRVLDLSNNSLSGDAASEITAYAAEHNIVAVSLQELNISNNAFEGNIGALASYMSSLTALNAEANAFTEVSPAIAREVSLNINDQKLTFDGDLTRGMEHVRGSIPAIAYYSHPAQGQSNSLSVSLSDNNQNPQCDLWMEINGNSCQIQTQEAYRGINGQELTGYTFTSTGQWTNRQQLSGLLSFAMGDANMTGDITVTDLQAMVNYIFRGYHFPAYNFTASNHNGDDIINVQDIVGEVSILLAQEPSNSSSSNLHAAPYGSQPVQASIFWNGDTLYLSSSVPVAALDIINAVDGNIRWIVDRLGMIASTAKMVNGEHAIIYSLNGIVIPAGITPLAISSSSTNSVVAATLSDAEAEEVSVSINNEGCGLNELKDSKVICHIDGNCLTINASTTKNDVDVTIYSIDGRVMLKHYLPLLESDLTINLSNVIDSNSYYIVVVRSSGHVIATQKLTQKR